MFSEYVHKRLKQLMESIKFPNKKQHNSIKEKNNNIGSIVIRKSNTNKELALFNLLDNQTVPLDGLYVHLNKEDYPDGINDLEYNFQWILDYFSDKIIIKWSDTYSKFNHLKIYPRHSHDNVFIFDENYDYDSITIEKALELKQERLILNLSKDVYHKRRVYDDSIVLFNTNDGSDLFNERMKDDIDSKNMITEDIFIPSFVIEDTFDIDKLKHEFNNNWEVFLTIYSFNNEYDIWNLGINYKGYVKNNTDMVLYKYLKLHPDILERWLKTYPGYSVFESDDVNCENVFKSTVDVGIINFNIPEMCIENVNGIYYRMLKIPNKVTVLDNSNKEVYYMWADHWSKYIHKDLRDKLVYKDNTSDKEFTRIIPKRDEKPYGFYLYQQSVKYLIENSTADYLFIFNSKAKMVKSIFFNDTCIMNEYSDYLRIFNLKLMREKGIKFTNFYEFREECLKQKCKIEQLKISNKLQCLPENFDKYNSTILATLHYRRHIMVKWLRDNYSKEFDNDYSRDY